MKIGADFHNWLNCFLFLFSFLIRPDGNKKNVVSNSFFENDGWKEAKDLRQGDSLFTFSGAKLRIDSVYQFKTDTANAVYNLEASGNHNYYVSASKVLVHNCETKLLSQFTTSTIDKGVVKSLKKLEHITNAKLHPKPWVKEAISKFGGEENMIRAVFKQMNGHFPGPGGLITLDIQLH